MRPARIELAPDAWEAPVLPLNYDRIQENIPLLCLLDKYDIMERLENNFNPVGNSTESNIMQNVTIYSTPTCHFCHMAKDFFKEKNIAYTEYNVASNIEKRKEMVEKSGQMGVPVIIIGDELIVGFDRPKISQLLGV